MRAGRLRHLARFWERQLPPGESYAAWQIACHAYVALKPPETTAAPQVSIRATRVTEAHTRPCDGIRPGQVMTANGRIYQVESTANAQESGRDLAIIAREFIGQRAVYQPKTGGAEYDCIGFLSQTNFYVGTDAITNEVRPTVDLLDFQLRPPYGEPGDIVEIAGFAFRADGVAQGFEDGYIVRLVGRLQ